MLPLHDIDAAILVGGLGTRLRGVVDDVPKPLAPVLGRPFLFYLLDQLALRGARSVTLCSGYKAELVRDAVGVEWLGMPVHHVVEGEPRGTGGALAGARAYLRSDRVLVLNGDSWLAPDWSAFRHTAESVEAALALVRVEDAERYGGVAVEGGRITAFREKAPGTGWINAGAYFLSRAVLEGLEDRPHSLEREVFPALAASGRLGGHEDAAAFLDIGVPESYAAAPEFFQKLEIAPHSMFPDQADATRAEVKLGTCAVIFDEVGRIVLERRSDCGWWCLPGGRMNPGETVAQAAYREAREETGLEIVVERFLGIFSDPRRRIVRYPDNGDLRQLVDAVVVGRPLGGQLERSEESLEVAWFAPERLPLNTVPPVVEILRQALQPGGGGWLR